MAHVKSRYLGSDSSDYYQFLYDAVAELNGDYEPIPTAIETFFGQKLELRSLNGGTFYDEITISYVGHSAVTLNIKELEFRSSYLHYLILKYIIDSIIEKSPSTINQIRYGFRLMKDIEIDESNLSEKKFSTQLSAKFSNLLVENERNQAVALAVRGLVRYGYENDYWGFDEALLFKIAEFSTPTHNQHTRVSLLDHEHGPFTRSEISDITHAINDHPNVSDRLLIRLAMQFGLRPIQLSLLREDDFYRDSDSEQWYLNIPQVKGRNAQKRRNPKAMISRLINEELVSDFQEKLRLNREDNCTDLRGKQLPRPLFKRERPNLLLLNQASLKAYAWHITSTELTGWFRLIGENLDIPSRYIKNEITDEPMPLKMNCYRFRYTLGTRMVMEGKTPEEVAEALGHSTTQSVEHYFRYNRDLIDLIDDSFESSKVIQNAVARWQGFMIDEDEQIGGTLIKGSDIAGLGKCLKTSRCEYHPTINCYSCSRFRPFKEANHEKQLELIRSERDFVMSHSSGPVLSQLDEALEGAVQIVEAQKQLIEEDRND